MTPLDRFDAYNRIEAVKTAPARFVFRPKMLKLRYGGWMAVTGPEVRVRIGVIGASKDHARAKFAAAVLRWNAIWDETATADAAAACRIAAALALHGETV